MNDPIKEELEGLLSEDIASVKERENKSFDRWSEKIEAHGMLLFGCGGFGRRTLQGLRKLAIEPLGFVDNKQSLWNNFVDGLPVFSPEEAVRRFPDALYMLTIWNDVIGHPLDEIEKALHRYSKVTVTSFTSLYWKYPDVFFPYFSLNSPHKTIEQANLISEAYALWTDDASRKEYVAQIRWRLWSDFGVLPKPVRNRQYFPDEIFGLTSNEVFVDIGAYDGDTLRDFIEQQGGDFAQYLAFEPDRDNFLKLQKQVMSLSSNIRERIVIKQLAIGSEKKTIGFNAIGSIQSSFKENGSVTVECISLDEALGDHNPTFIKMDTEGFEAEIIKGAKRTVREFSPILAIAIYHQYDHLWQLPLAVHELSGSYDFYLRPYQEACWELVCYAVPKTRVNIIER